MRKSYSFIPDQDFIDKALQFANRETHVAYLNPNDYEYPHGAFQHLLAFGLHKELSEHPTNNFEELKHFLDLTKDWTFGYFSYDLKNELEQLSSHNHDKLNFPLLHFFIPKHLLIIKKDRIEIQSFQDPEQLFLLIQKEEISHLPSFEGSIQIHQKIKREDYISKVKRLQELILSGEIYEINFCQEYFAENVQLNPLSSYRALNAISPMPFSCYLKIHPHYLLCASPERFLKKEKSTLISQPIKGTAKRDQDPKKDEFIREQLSTSEKERAENIMIVDLVRNDLSRTAIPGSVLTEELCGIHSFPQVHQMISTIVAEINNTFHPIESIQYAFPMGSMTGAPKVKAMQLIEIFEETKRGLFSGAVGYFTPELDFDFNVVIRSILYNAHKKILSFQAGSAITFYSEAEKEYEECGIKTSAIRRILNSEVAD